MTLPVSQPRSPSSTKTARELRGFLDSLGHGDIACADVEGQPPGQCTGCRHSDDGHPGFAVVIVETVDGFHEDVLCLVVVSTYLAVAKHQGGFIGASIEVITKPLVKR